MQKKTIFTDIDYRNTDYRLLNYKNSSGLISLTLAFIHNIYEFSAIQLHVQ